ncbi:MAG: hypothetical protein MUF71_19295 [Candidatus Kapabacteria bacterium]|jgi:hypothetical protein|nr:hypothetical protein [Candidatus Kapabacteria bacterium]
MIVTMIDMMKSIGFKALFAVVPVMAIVVATNFIVDPANVIHNVAPEVAGYLLGGQNVSLIKENFGMRELREEYLQRNSQVNVVVLGSSRSLQVRKWMLADSTESFYNASVANAQLDLYQGLYAILKKQNHVPKTIVFCCDHWLFDLPRVESVQTAAHINTGFSPFKLSSLANRIIPTRYMEMMSFSYFQSSLAFLRVNRSLMQFYPTKDTSDKNMLILADGGIQYDLSIRQRSVEDVRRIVEMDLRINNAKKKGDPSKFEERKVDPKRIAGFEELLKTMKNDGVRVVLFLSPYHPLFYKNLPSLDATEAIFREVAVRQNVEIIGAYNPEQIALTEADFFDYWHPTPEGLARVFAEEKVSKMFFQPKE